MEKAIGIREASRQTGISEKKLRHWQEAGYITPDLVPVGDQIYREYRSHHIRLLKKIKEYRDQGFMLKVAFEKATDEFEVKEK